MLAPLSEVKIRDIVFVSTPTYGMGELIGYIDGKLWY